MIKKYVDKNKTSLLFLLVGFVTIFFREIGMTGGGAVHGKNAILIGCFFIVIGVAIYIRDNFFKKLE